jgi:hypothetical protein
MAGELLFSREHIAAGRFLNDNEPTIYANLSGGGAYLPNSIALIE